jgi:hypothetical protein
MHALRDTHNKDALQETTIQSEGQESAHAKRLAELLQSPPSGHQSRTGDIRVLVVQALRTPLWVHSCAWAVLPEDGSSQSGISIYLYYYYTRTDLLGT